MWRKKRFLASSAEGPKPKDTWDVLDIIAKALIPIALLYGGWLVNHGINASTQSANDIRSALELQIRRDSSDATLKGIMATQILNRYGESRAKNDIQSQLLYLELLVQNSSPPLDLTSMIRDVKRQILQDHNSEQEAMLARLGRLLNNAKSAQTAAIATNGAIKNINLSEGSDSYSVVIQYCNRNSSLPLRIPVRVNLIKSISDEPSAILDVYRFRRIGGSLEGFPSEISVHSSDLPLIQNILIAPGLRLSLIPFAPSGLPKQIKSKTTDIGITLLAFSDELATPNVRRPIGDYLETLMQNVYMNSGSRPNDSNACQEMARAISFVKPNSYDFVSLKLSN